AYAAQGGGFVGTTRLPPAPIRVLGGHEPTHGTPDIGLVHRLIHRAQATQDVTGAIDIIDPPAPIPRAIRLLLALHKTQRPLDNTMRTREADEPEEFERPTGHVARARVQHGFMVSKGNLVQNGLIIVHIKSPPAAIIALHAEEPLQTTLQDLPLFLVGKPGLVQRN